MQLSSLGKELLKQLEGVRLLPYDDRTGKTITKWCPQATIGIGYLIPQKEFDDMVKGITLEEAYHLLEMRMRPVEKAVQTALPGFIAQNKFDALCLLAYNIGLTAFRQSSVLKILLGKPANYPTLEKAWLAFCMDEGKVSASLLARRKKEYLLYSEEK